MIIVKKINAIIISTALALVMLLLPVASTSAQLFQGSKGEACQGATLDDSGNCSLASNNDSVNNVVANGINVFSLVIGVIAVIMIMIGGLRYITSSGDPASTKSARDTILYAVIGLVVVALAQIIVRFVLTKV